MKKIIIYFICCAILFATFIKADEISDFLAKTISGTPNITIAQGNAYTKDYDFLFLENSKQYIPYSYNDLLNIIYSIINQGWNEFTFYCPMEYSKCIEDMTKLSKDDFILTHINNYVHPFNSFDTLQTSISESGEINVKVNYLYTKEEIAIINDYIIKLKNNIYNKDLDDYENLKNIHDHIINNTKYDIKRNDDGKSDHESYNAIGPVTTGYATCNGYADLMAIILYELGYENYKIATTSDEISYKSNGHVWNAVKIDDEWLHLDLTWDDPVSNDGKDYLYHKYFLVNTNEMQKADSGEVSIEEHNFNKAIYQEFLVIT